MTKMTSGALQLHFHCSKAGMICAASHANESFADRKTWQIRESRSN